MRKILAGLALISFFVASPAFANSPLWTFSNCGIASLSGSSQSLVSASPTRHYLEVCNFGATNDNVTLGLAGETAVANQGLNLVPGACKEFSDSPDTLVGPPSNAITIIGTSTQPVTCYQGF